jgi:hypothetical protein
MLTVMLHGMDDREWSNGELHPIKSFAIQEITRTNSALGVTLTLADGKVYEIDFKDIDGYRSC